jgi:DNA-binding transcriptional ArsR family regulator
MKASGRHTSGDRDPDRAEPQSSAQRKANRREQRQVITDARAMRALAHPVRVALLDALHRDGEITATRAAEMLGESPGNMSWHLQTLAKYGFVEETGKGRGRSRPWRLTSASRSFETGAIDTETAAAGEALESTFLQRTEQQLREWWSRRPTYPARWRRAAFVTDSIRYLTADELSAVMDELVTIYDRYADRTAENKRPAGALPVHLYAHGHPLPPTPAGN